MTETESRWDLAQSYEKNWWADRTETIDLSYLKYYAEDLQREVATYININSTTKILEIGSGPAGILTFLPSDNRYAVDPLEDYFSSIEQYRSFRDKNVRYQKAMGEHLPFDDSQFDFIIMDNVLDHTRAPGTVIAEMYRVLKNGGLVYFRQNTYHLWGKGVRELMEVLKIDKGHPHTFLKSSLVRLLKKNHFTIEKRISRGYYATWKSELRSPRKIDVLKALLFATRDKTLYILKKQ